MAIVKATYTKHKNGAKASIRYIEHRPGKEGEKINRTLFNGDGAMGRWQAYRLIDEAEKGSVFFRFLRRGEAQPEAVAAGPRRIESAHPSIPLSIFRCG